MRLAWATHQDLVSETKTNQGIGICHTQVAACGRLRLCPSPGRGLTGFPVAVGVDVRASVSPLSAEANQAAAVPSASTPAPLTPWVLCCKGLSVH